MNDTTTMLFKIAIEADGVDQGAKQAESAITSAMNKIKTSVEDASKSFAGLGDAVSKAGSNIAAAGQAFTAGFSKGMHELGESAESGMKRVAGALGEGGKLILEFGEKVAGAVPNAVKAFDEIGEAFSKAGGGMKGVTAAAGALGEALPTIATGAAAVVGAMTALETATAGIGAHLLDLRESAAGTEGAFAKLEIMGRQTSLGIDAMVSVITTLRSGIKDSARELHDFAESLQVMRDRQRDATENLEIHKRELELTKKEQQGYNVEVQQSALAHQKQQLELQRSETALERLTARMNRQIREMQDNASGITKIFLGFADLKIMEPEKIEKIANVLDDLKKKAGPEQLVAFMRAMEELGSKSPEAALKVQKAMDATFGSNVARLLREYQDELQRTGTLSEESAERISHAMGNLSKDQAGALDKLKQEMKRTGEEAENMAARFGAAFAKTEAGKAAISGLHNAIGVLDVGLQLLSAAINANYEILLAWVNGYLQADAAISQFFGNMKRAAEDIKQYNENLNTMRKIEKENREIIENIRKGSPATPQEGQPVQPEQLGPMQYVPPPHSELESAGQDAAKSLKSLAEATPQNTDAQKEAAEAAKKNADAQTDAAEPVKNLGEKAADTSSILDKLVSAISSAIASISGTPVSEQAHPAGMASGGMLHGPGTETSDSIPILASRGEYVVNADAVKHYGVGTLHALNAKQMAVGGVVGYAEGDEVGGPVGAPKGFSVEKAAREHDQKAQEKNREIAANCEATLRECQITAQETEQHTIEEVAFHLREKESDIAETLKEEVEDANLAMSLAENDRQVAEAQRKADKAHEKAEHEEQKAKDEADFKDQQAIEKMQEALDKCSRVNGDCMAKMEQMAQSHPGYTFGGGAQGFASGGLVGFAGGGDIDSGRGSSQYYGGQDDDDRGYARGGLLGASLTNNSFALGGGIGSGFPGFLGAGLSSVAANAGSSSSFVGGLHPVNIHLPGLGAFGGFSGTPTAIAQIGKAAMIQRMTSAGRPASSYG
jgi:hypothetical protein